MREVWPWLISFSGLACLWAAGSGRRWGWLCGLVTECVWIAYAVTSRQWGFLPPVPVYMFVYTRNWLRWKGRELRRADSAAAVAGAEAEVVST